MAATQPETLTQPVTRIAVDIGNSRIKLGRFDWSAACETAAKSAPLPIAAPTVIEPADTLQLAIDATDGTFDATQLFAWCDQLLIGSAHWFVATVHRAAADEFRSTIDALDPDPARHPLRVLTQDDIPLAVAVPAPDRVGIDRLVAAVAADRLRSPGRPVIVVDHGSAITVDLVTGAGEFAGGAIMPGTAMGARALAEQTDALPFVPTEDEPSPPPPVGSDTRAAIRAGLYWGATGAVRELVQRMAAALDQRPQVFVTGGAGDQLALELATDAPGDIRHVPHLVLAGIELVGRRAIGAS